MIDAVETAIWKACDERTFSHGSNSHAIVNEMASNIIDGLPDMIEDLFWIGSQYLKQYSSGPYTVQHEYDANGNTAWTVGFHGILISDHNTQEAAQEAANIHRKAAIVDSFKTST